MASKLHLELALTPDGWRRDVVVRIDHGLSLGKEEPGRGETQSFSGVGLGASCCARTGVTTRQAAMAARPMTFM